MSGSTMSVVEVVRDLSCTMDAQERYKRLLARLHDFVPYDSAAILMYSHGVLVPIAVAGMSDAVLGRRFEPDMHPRFAAILGCDAPVLFQSDDPRPDPFDGLMGFDDQATEGVHSCMGARLCAAGETLGVITADAALSDQFGEAAYEGFQLYAALAAAALRTARLLDELRERAERGEQVARVLNRDSLRQAGELIGTSRQTKFVRDEIRLVAGSDLSVLIAGETGTGKEIVARQVHARSPRAQRPLVYVNCAALPESLAESELFGHRRGAFTGAVSDRGGKFELAHLGTLFLDEVAELPLAIQPKLLLALQFGEVQRVGDDRVRYVDVRVISATNRDLEAAVQSGEFREDLLHRLAVYPIPVPPLRERPDDIELIASHILERTRKKLGTLPLRLTAAACAELRSYSWPGNVREMEHVLLRAALRARELSDEVVSWCRITPDELQLKAPIMARRPVQVPPCSGDWRGTFREQSDAFERQILERALSESQGCLAEAARALGMDRSNFRRTAKRLGVLPRRV